MLEAEHAAGERAIPEQVVERREEQGCARRAAVELRSCFDHDRRSSVLDLQPLERPGRHKGIDMGTDARDTAAQSPVLRDRGLCQRPPGTDRAQDELADGIALGRRRRFEEVPREHALRQVVHSLKPAHPARDDELARAEQGLQDLLRRLPAPHRALAGRTVEVARGEGAALADRLQNLLGQARVACADVATPRVMRAELLPHPAEERPVVGGQETRLVRPVFDDVILPEQLRNGSGGVDADTCRDGHAVASLDGRDRVELDARRTGNSGLDLVCAGSTGSRSVALGGDDEPSERRQGDGAHATHASDRTAASDSCSGPLGSHVVA